VISVIFTNVGGGMYNYANNERNNMPNWVFNTLTIQGPREQLDSIKKQLNSPFTRDHENWDMQSQSMKTKTYTYSNPIFSFWNICKPDDLDAYMKQPEHKPNQAPEDMFKGDDWYSWNVRNWGTKWDVSVSDDSEYSDTELIEDINNGEDQWLVYRFDTAWSPPVPAMEKLSALVPNCVVTLSYEEEQGWGGEMEFVNGKITANSEYGWKCRECDVELEEVPYCEECDYDTCPKCGYGEPDEKCQTHSVELTPSKRKEA
jgi:Ferredoxin-like domain in Api92-like protein